MNAPTATTAYNRRLSLRHTVACVAALALMTTLAACDKKADGTAPAGSASSTGATTAAAAAKKAKTTLKVADMRSAYKSEIDNMPKAKDPMEKKVDAFVAKIGKPESDSGRKKVWYALDGDKCLKVEIDGKDGSISEASADKAECGM